MRRRAIITTIAVAACSLASALTVTQQQVDNALNTLDTELARRSQYLSERQARIDSIRALLAKEGTTPTSINTIMRLADEFSSYNNDSAIYYYDRGQQIAIANHNDSAVTMFALKRAMHMPLAAFINEAVDLYNGVDSTQLSPRQRELYYDAGRQMYSYISSFYLNYPQVHDQWAHQGTNAQFKLLQTLNPASDKYKLNLGEYYFANCEYTKAKAILEELIENLEDDDNLYARACHMLADIAKSRGNSNEYLYYLSLSATGDIKSATLEVTSLQELGSLMFQQGDIDRAYLYLSTALAEAVDCHASMRMIQSSTALPIIEQAHMAQINAWRHRIYWVIAGMAVLLVILGGVLLILHREMKRMKALQLSLEKANSVKEVYISQFLNLCSIYMDKLTQFSKTVNRKIAANKIDDLYKITKSGKFVEEQSREFYEVFDNAFLHIYPTFVESVNRLLRPDEQIILKEGETLNTDLRILAFMRLGIEESTRIAQILNYSVYTIYTYRNKLKNRAINRDTFEDQIMQISSIS